MSTLQSSLGAVIGINARLLYATMMSAFGWYIWPETMRDFGWGLISICLWLSSFGLVVEATKSALVLYSRDKTVKKFVAQGDEPKTARMAHTDDLKNSGMM